MKKLMILSVTLLLPVFAYGKLEDQNVFVSLPQLMGESKAGKEANAALETYRAKKAEELNKKAKALESTRADLQKANTEFETKKPLLKNFDAEQKKITELNRKVAKLETEFQASAKEAEEDFRAEYMRLSEQLFKEQIDALSEWGKTKNVYAITDLESGRVLYCRETANITKEVLTAVDQKHAQKIAQAKAPAASVQTAAAKPASSPAA